MEQHFAVARACPNIALIKYWGDIDPSLHIPANGSISMNLGGLSTVTQVKFDRGLATDEFALDGRLVKGESHERVGRLLDHVRRLAGIGVCATVESTNNFPMGAGIASSASGFAALSLAACKAAGVELAEKDLCRLARLGSGSACRSIPGGFVEWQAGNTDEDSYAYSLFPADHWDLVDCIAVVSRQEKSVSSAEGHRLAGTSPLQVNRVQDAPRRLDQCRQALSTRDFAALADIVELDSDLMHQVMLTSHPALDYRLPATLGLMESVRSWRREGIPACYTVDAGPNVHVLCPADWLEKVRSRLLTAPGVIELLVAHPGGPARLA